VLPRIYISVILTSERNVLLFLEDVGNSLQRAKMVKVLIIEGRSGKHPASEELKLARGHRPGLENLTNLEILQMSSPEFFKPVVGLGGLQPISACLETCAVPHDLRKAFN
jgi:hypothetical protein